MIFFPCGRRLSQILLKLPVEAGQARISHLPCDHIDRHLIQMNQMAGLPDPVMLDIIQRADSCRGMEEAAKMAFADMAAFCKLANGQWFHIMVMNIGKRISDTGISILRGKERLLFLLDRHSVEAGKKRIQKSVDDVLIKRTFYMQFLKNIPQKSIQAWKSVPG